MSASAKFTVATELGDLARVPLLNHCLPRSPRCVANHKQEELD